MVLRYIIVFESSRYNILGRFAIRHLCVGFLDRKMTVRLNGGSEDLFSFWMCPLDVLVASSNERDLFRKDYWLQGKLTPKGNRDNKERC